MARFDTEIRRLKSHYLPLKRRPFGTYTKAELENTRAFYVFSHAAVEAYLEARALRVALKARDQFVNHKRSSKTLIALAAFGLPVKNETDPWILKPSRHQPLRTMVHKIVATYERELEQNHGVKEDNLRRILGPIGVEDSELDGTWVAAMTSFGEKRGKAVHAVGASFTMAVKPDPFSAEKEVDELIKPPGGDGLEALDRLLQNR